MQQYNTSKFHGYVTLIGGSFMQFAISSLFTYGNLVPYFASYLAYIDYAQSNYSLDMDELENNFNKQIMRVNWIYFIYFFTYGFGVYFGGSLEIKYGPRTTYTLASFLTTLGFGFTYFALEYGGRYAFVWCMLTYGIILGSGVGIAFPVLVVVGMRWFPDKQGFIGGFCLAMLVSGAVVFDSLQSFLINPDHIHFNAKVGYAKQPQIIARIPLMCIYIALIMWVMQIISILCVSNPPWFVSNALHTNLQITKSNEKQMTYEKYSLTVRETMNFGSFWILCLQTFFYVMLSTVAMMQWKIFAVSYLQILDDEYLSLIGSMAALLNAGARIFWGMLYDWTGKSFRVTQGSMSVAFTVFLVTWPLSIYSPYTMYPIWSLLIFFCVNGCFAIYPSVISNSFGAKYVGSILGCLTVAEVFSTFVVVAISTRIHIWFNGWVNYLLVIGIAGVFSTFLSIIYNPDIDKKKYLKGKRLILSAESSVNSYSSFDS